MSNPSILLQICCAPCSTVPVQRLSLEYYVHGFFYNPNIYPEAEYQFRAEECRRFFSDLGLPVHVGEYEKEKWENETKGWEQEPENGKRCFICYYMRLKSTAEKAISLGISFFTTTLTISPHKNANIINKIGNKIAFEMGIKFVERDFKKQDGFIESCRISKKNKMYRQDYCGCKYSIHTECRKNKILKKTLY